ncbi:MAG TPA: DNA polymerase III subunit delta' [Tepidisphaeraceae bacterium]|nr:DNA polymerase III subunit delta' [Tepidisphaeraceae bacterium]
MTAHSFDSIFGQQAAINWLQQAYLADHLPHAMIFAGPVGVGKGTTAAALSKLFLCENPKKAQPCGVCDGCRTFDGGNHPDYHVIAKEHIRYHDKTGTSKGIDLSIKVIRPEMIEPAGRKAVMGRGKVFIIEQAELMNHQAQNAMLKTLEEPYGRTLIILLTDQPSALLPTIRSRCQTVRFAALDEKMVREEMIRRGIDAKAAADASALSRGSLGVALKWVEDEVIGPARNLIAMIDALFAGRPPDDLPGWFKAAADAYAAKQLERDELSSKDQATREGLTLYLLLAGEHIRRRMLASEDEVALESACNAIDALVQAETFLDANVNISLIFQQLAVRLSAQV